MASSNMVSSSSDQSASIQCSNCASATATLWCGKCDDVSYCSECYTTVHAYPALRAHRSVPISERPPEMAPCVVHPRKELEFWCYTCDTLICTNCRLFAHQDHKFDLIEEVAKEVKANLKTGLEEIQLSLNQRQTMAAAVKYDNKGKITESVAFLHKMIDEYEERLQQQSLAIETKNEQLIEDYQTQLQSHHQMQRDQSAEFTRILLTNSPTKLLQAKKGFVDYLNKTTEELRELAPPILTNYHIEGFNQLQVAVERRLRRLRIIETSLYQNSQLNQDIVDDRESDTAKDQWMQSFVKTCQFRSDKKWLDRQYYDDGRDKRIMKPDELEDMMEDPSGSIDEELLNPIHGSMIGMALGDALGAHVEFRTHAYLVEHPVTDFQEDEVRGLKKGQPTDATSMALCLANSLIARRHFNPYDQLVRYKWWYKNGYMTSTGRCFDIGENTSESFDEFQRRQASLAKDHQIPLEQLDFLSDYNLLADFNVDCSKIGAAGNGALARLAPIPLFFHKWPIHAVEFSGRSGQITHGDPKAYDACRYYGALIVATLRGESKEQLLDNEFYVKHKEWFNGKRLHTDIEAIAKGSYKQRRGYDDGIRGSGYIVNTLQAALWAFWADENNFEKGALAAVNLGDDTDTTAAIYGQLAGVYYGFKKLPEKWRDQVYAKDFIKCVSKWIVYEGKQWHPE